MFYFAIPRGSACLKEGTRLHEFIHTEDDAFRRRRLTLIPAIPQGSWLVRNAVGSDRFVMLAQVPCPPSPPSCSSFLSSSFRAALSTLASLPSFGSLPSLASLTSLNLTYLTRLRLARLSHFLVFPPTSL